MKKGWFFIILLITTVLHAQNFKSFTDDPAVYIDELRVYFASDRNASREEKDATERLLKEYASFFNDELGAFEQQHLINVSNALLKNKIKTYPNFFNFLQTQLKFVNSQVAIQNLQPLFEAMKILAEGRKISDFNKLIDATSLLLNEQKLYKSMAANWQVSLKSFRFINNEKPAFIFENADLMCFSNSDTIFLYQTNGTFFPLSEEWQGEGGEVNFTAAGYSADEIFVKLSKYTIDLKTSRYTANDVKYTNRNFFTTEIPGKVQDKITVGRKGESALYPQFESYDYNLTIENLFENVNFKGKFTHAGARIQGGDKTEPAVISFLQNNKTKVKISSPNFIIRKKRISTSDGKFIALLETDSMFQVSAEIRFDNENRLLTVQHPQTNVYQLPFLNTYHEVNMYFDALYWRIDSSYLDMRGLDIPGKEGVLRLESVNIFSQSEYDLITDKSDKNPLFLLRKASQKYDNRQLWINDLVPFFGLSPVQIKALINFLASHGFVIYNAKEESVYLQDKLFNYQESGAKNIDYDALQIQSEIMGHTNSRLDLNTNDLWVYGVKHVHLSDTQNVYFRPTNRTLRVQKNRDLSFNGFIHSGKFDFYASGCHFIYDSFAIIIDVVDTLSFSVKKGEPDIYGNHALQRIGTQIEYLSGTIFIDRPNNKSGLKNYKKYPIFQSLETSYVFYDQPNVQQGVYDRNRFYFAVDSFRLENMNNFETDALRFKGHLVSGDIFPVIYESLRVMPDYSLGFPLRFPENGMPVYKNHGQFFDSITLSNDGLIGCGRITYATSELQSKRFIFMLDSMKSNVRTLDVKRSSEQTISPFANVEKANIQWYPYNDLMRAQNTDSLFAMYENEIKLKGELLLSSEQTEGSGQIFFKNNSEMVSRHYLFKSTSFNGDTVDFFIRTKDKKLAVKSENYHADISFDTKKGLFTSNGDASMVSLPAIQYICYMNEMEFDMQSDQLDLKNSTKSLFSNEELSKMSVNDLVANIDVLPGSDFISIHPKQDSLQFKSPRANYKIENGTLDVYDARVIFVADAAIAPIDGHLEIKPNADIQEIKNASVLMDRESQYHLLYAANVKINSRSKYTASGKYDYLDINHQLHPISFAGITPFNGESQGTAKISNDSALALNPYFRFSGLVTLNAQDSLLIFTGNAYISHTCDALGERSGIPFSTRIDPYEVAIPIADPTAENPRSRSLKRLGSGFFFESNGSLAPAFFTQVKTVDLPVVPAFGTLHYDTETHAYLLDHPEDSLNTSYVSLDTRNCILKTYDQLNPQVDLGRVIPDMFGSLSQDLKKKDVLMDAVAGFSFHFSAKAMEKMTNTIKKSSAPGSEINTDKFIDFIYKKLNHRDADRLVKEISSYGSYKRIPSQFKYAILFSDLKMQWDDNSKSFISMGRLGVANIGNEQINRQLNGYVQLQRNRRGDVLNIYIEISRQKWYFFSYSNGLMQALSSDEDFNNEITSLKPSKRKSREGEGRGSYEFDISTLRKKGDFVYKMRQINGEDSDSIYDDEEEVEDTSVENPAVPTQEATENSTQETEEEEE